MSSYLKITFRTFTIWLLASLINGFLCGLFLSISEDHGAGMQNYIMIIFIVSLIFSAPGFFIFWIVLLIKYARYVAERALFRAALVTEFILASVTAILAGAILRYEFSSKENMLALFIIISAITSIMLHFNHFKKIK